ncbi:MAG: hypothetical protein V1771_05100 [Chloroflexota bacterium]
MAYRKRTLRKLPEVTREYCKLINEMQSILKRAKNLAERVESLELDSKALANSRDAIWRIDCPACREVLAKTGKRPDYCSSCGFDRRSVLGEKKADDPQDGAFSAHMVDFSRPA